MSVGLIPLNQQDALPLYNTLAGAGSGQVTLLGDALIRFFAAGALGLDSGLPAPGNWITRAAQFNLESQLLDFRGCHGFSLVCTFTNNTGLAVGINYGVYLVQATSGGVPPQINNDKGNMIRVGNLQAGSLAAGASVTRDCGWCTGALMAAGPGTSVSMSGGYWQVVINTINATQSINGMSVSSQLWAQS